MFKNKLLSIFLILTVSGFFYLFEIRNHQVESSINNYCLNSFSIKPDLINNRKKSNEYLIIGHAYGNHSGSNKGISNKVLKYFESLDKKNNIILTGDFVRSGSKEDLLLVKRQVESYFKNGMFAVGNHEIKTNQNNYYDVFENDLFMISENKVDLVVANFSTSNWLPKLPDQNKINSFIKSSKNEIIILFSHQIFWENMTNKKPKKNGPDLLDDELTENMLDWLNIGNKKLIIISGDYGLNSDEIFCEQNNDGNILFIANGIYENDNDKLIRLSIYSSGFYFEEVKFP
tara:strand:- start:33240 stop:34103 length:864 start_codon:yes stop_codon:yes gene_type:complete